jgi:hypothetical protein
MVFVNLLENLDEVETLSLEFPKWFDLDSLKILIYGEDDEE